MKSLIFIIPNALLDKVVEEAERLGVSGALLMRAAIIAFAENPIYFIEPLPPNYNKEELKGISLKLPEDIIKKIHLYANSRGFSIRRIVWSMIDHFLTLDDEQKMFYIKKVKEILSRTRIGRKRKTKLQETIVFGDLNALVGTSFACSNELHNLIENEAIKKHITISELIRETINEFLKKYSNNFEEIRKLHETASNLFSGEDPQRVITVKLPAHVLLQLEKISGKTLVPKGIIIRLAIMNHFNLLNRIVTKQRKATQNEAANDPPDDPPPQNYKPKPRWAGGFVSVLLPEPLYDLLKEYVMLKYHRGFILSINEVISEVTIKFEVSEIATKILKQWAKRRFSGKSDVQTYVVWQIILGDLKMSFYPGLKRGTIVKKQDILDAMKNIKLKSVINKTELFEELFEIFKERGYLKEIDNDNVKILLL
ncbi:hypothetical protein STSV2_23 [Sulfolobus virus STSV2]|uniref:hypothetical protein n=1 Tax=Sulfolobus virus STSV2 TaxID=1123964 RepID=UPI0002A7D875|nr:hypothetical protein STSV2_23 [Sulfolobus virus STSV2]AFU92002.1 hypothetical protein STSV2_23 [Sulfolobus virus STSV2]